MSSNAYTTFNTKKTPQSEPIPGQTQVKNSAGGYVYELDKWKRLERFLILGSEGGTYYVGEKPLTKANALSAVACIQEDGKRAVDLVVAISDGGRAPKNDPAIFVLALAASAGLPTSSGKVDKFQLTRQYALANLSKVCRIPTHLYHFNEFCKGLRGWGRTLKRANQEWFNGADVKGLAYQLVKYQQRDGWAASDVLRKAHPKTVELARNALYRWVVDGYQEGVDHASLPDVVQAFEMAKTANKSLLIKLIKQHNLSREMLPTEALNDVDVWSTLLEKMPYTAMLRNLGTMSKVGLLKPLSDASETIAQRLVNPELLQKARIHPISVLLALKTYSQGKGFKGSNTWTVVPSIVDALDEAFYKAFDFVEPTGKRFLVGVDVSGSMSSACGGLPISCAEGAAAMALALAKTEPKTYIHGFTAGVGRYSIYRRGAESQMDGFVDLGITPKMRLDAALARTRGLNFGNTDCALPALYATQQDLKVDAIVIVTDNETWAGGVHPSQALRTYREKSGIPVRQIVIGMTSTGFSIASPDDPLSIDVAGFDSSVPQLIQEFCKL